MLLPLKSAWLLTCFSPCAAAKVRLYLGRDLSLHTLSALSSGGARVVALASPEVPSGRLEHLPAEFAGLKELTKLSLSGSAVPTSAINGSWQRLPRQLKKLRLSLHDLKHIPAELASLDQLTELELSWCGFKGGWDALPRQLHKLDLTASGLARIPAALSRLAQLSELCLQYNIF